MEKRDDASDERPEDDTEESTESETDSDRESEADSPAAPVEAKRKRSGSKAARRRASASDGTREAITDRAGKPAAGNPMSKALLFAGIALAAGVAAGWFGHQAQAKAKLRADSAAPATSGSSGPCNAWQQKICGSSGEQSAACQQAKGAAELLTNPSCEVALEAVPATLARVKAARASCDGLVTKLCNDLPKGSSTCTMVTERTASFPPAQCKEMMTHYDEVIAQLKMIDQQGGPQGGPGGPGGPGPGGPGGPGSPH